MGSTLIRKSLKRVLLDYFLGSPRPIQKDILGRVESALNSGYKKIIIQSPTGTGKSFLAATIGRWSGSSSILTATTELQDQYSKDFAYMRTVRGKTHFPCLQLDSVDSCNKGLCYDPKTEENCSFKPHKSLLTIEKKGTLKERIIYTPHNFSEPCHYYFQKYAGEIASHTVYNYAEFFSSVFYTKDAPKKVALIFDEAHAIEDKIVDFVSLELIRSEVEKIGLQMPEGQQDLGTWIGFANDVDKAYSCAISELKSIIEENSDGTTTTSKDLAELEGKHDRLSYVLKKMKDKKENFVISKTTLDKNGNMFYISIEPIDVGIYLNDVYPFGDVIVFMSATIDDQMFCKSIGQSKENCAFIQVKESPFPVQSRPVHFLNIARLNKNLMESAMPKMISKIDEIMNKHGSEKGIILTTSNKQVDDIIQGVSIRNAQRFHRTGNDLTRSALMKLQKDSDTPTVIISPSMYEGIDLKDEMSRFQIIVKAPYLDLSNGRVSAKLKLDPQWYAYRSVMKLVQGAGRSIRHENDFAITYILDESATDLVKRTNTMLPQWFKESIIETT